MSKKPKYYVVWVGREPGIYTDWDSCRAQVNGAPGARYKSFATRQEAEAAYADPDRHIAKRTAAKGGKKAVSSRKKLDAADLLLLDDGPMVEAWAVDAACSGNPGSMEYQGVDILTGKPIFHYGPVFGTNNIGEFLAIVHALALQQQRGVSIPIYSDSRNALLWVKGKKCKTSLKRTDKTEELFAVIARAEKWLQENAVTTKLMKWETDRWGEIPADFGRK